jgi:hypothetical protein
MSLPKISAIPVETYLYEDTLTRVDLKAFDELPEPFLTHWRESKRRRGEETEIGEIYVWTPRKKQSYGRFSSPFSARPRRQLRKDTTNLPKVRHVDVYQLRDRFFEIVSPEQGLHFFTEYGIFGGEQRNSFNLGLTYADLVLWQELLKECRLSDPSDWEALAERYSRLRHVGDILQIPEFSIGLEPHLQLRLQCECIRDAIMAATYLEKLRDVKSSMCQRLDCGVVFNHESRHHRKYCSSDCAHLEAVRRNRKKRAG